ncbi:unnamed protein product [Cochlearia groenlandica]
MKTKDSIHSFFRVYIPNYSIDDMNLPFVSDEISGISLPRKVIVKSMSSRKVWCMEMNTNNSEGGTVFLREGWKKIVEEENLKEPTFLVFEFDGSRIFNFSVYEHGSMCKRVRSPMKNEVIVVESDDDNQCMVMKDKESKQ